MAGGNFRARTQEGTLRRKKPQWSLVLLLLSTWRRIAFALGGLLQKRGQHPQEATGLTLHPPVNTLRSSNATLIDREMKHRGLVPAYWRVLKSHYLILQLFFLQ